MKVTRSTIEKITITGIKNLDAIAVMAENFGPGQGKITITCFNESWSYYWGAMGEDNTLAEFFVSCDEDYLAGKLGGAINPELQDEDDGVLVKTLRAKIVQTRRMGDMGRHLARDLWDESDMPLDCNGYVDADLFRRVFGSDWYEYLPQKPNPKYEYLCRIIKTVQEAFVQMEETKEAR